MNRLLYQLSYLATVGFYYAQTAGGNSTIAG